MHEVKYSLMILSKPIILSQYLIIKHHIKWNGWSILYHIINECKITN